MVRRSSSNVERGAEILIELGKSGPSGMTLAEISDAIGAAKSAVHRSLSGLVQYGFVEQTSRRGRYKLGPAIFGLSAKPHSTQDLVRAIKPTLIEISRKSGGASFLLVRAGADSLCLDLEEGDHPFQPLVGGIGGRIPMGVGAASICMLAEMDVNAREALIVANEHRFSSYTSRAQIEEAIRFYHLHGYIYFINYSFVNYLHLAVSVPKKIAPSAAVSLILTNDPTVEPSALAAMMKEAVYKIA